MILLADPHPFIVQETVSSIRCGNLRKVAELTRLRDARHNRFSQCCLNGRLRDFSAAFIELLVSGIV